MFVFIFGLCFLKKYDLVGKNTKSEVFQQLWRVDETTEGTDLVFRI